jgi:hypothetical protein
VWLGAVIGGLSWWLNACSGEFSQADGACGGVPWRTSLEEYPKAWKGSAPPMGRGEGGIKCTYGVG